MKHFSLILTVTRIIVILLFTANVIFMVQLYNSIKERYIDDVEQCLRRAEQIELTDRIIASGLGDADNVVWLNIGLQKSETEPDMSAEDMLASGYSQGYRRMDKQLISVITQHLHEYYDNNLGSPDLEGMKEAFIRDLNFSGYYPAEVYIIGPGGAFEYPSGLWHISCRIDDHTVYDAYITPLTGHILREMSGVIVTSVLIALVLTFGFWYLLHVISHLRTIEEMKDDFTNNMTHELKTPIAIAYAANDSLLQFPDPTDEERTKKYLTAALEQLSKLTGLVENILAMSMERRKHLTLTEEPIDLKEFLRAIAEQQKLKADKECNINVECNEGIVINADPVHFSNVIGNLIDNSIKYSGDSVSITIRATAQSVSVSDNGIGIPQKALPHIFNKFYRVPHGNRSDVRGYGIGLFYVKSIVDRHGWHIEVESTPDKGSKFTIFFRKK